MAEIYCKDCKQVIGPTAHKVGGPECIPSQPVQQEKKELPKDKLNRRLNLVRQGLPYRKTLD